ncbi:MAG: GMC family oxidoreductase N-terminal domain-containing protein, partial [Burkholderiales bacterium]
LDRRLYWPGGKVLGGSTSINGLIYLRGLPSDYDRWAALGNPGWSYADVAPCFDRLEGLHDARGRPVGTGGPLHMAPTSWRTALTEAFIDTASQLTGQPRHDDGFNAGTQLGGGYFTLTQCHGRRSSSATAYLAPARRRANLTQRTGATARRIEFDGTHARAVTYEQGGALHQAQARREIIVCAGTEHTPQLLQASGVGPAEVLQRCCVPLVHDLAGVGADLHDHFTVRFTLRTGRRGVTLNDVAGRLPGQARSGVQWALSRSGPFTIGAGVAGAYIKSDPALPEPDYQLILVPYKTDKLYTRLTEDPGFQIAITPSRPTSRGRLAIRSADPRMPPAMMANYFATEADRQVVVRALRATRQFLASPTMAPFVAEELQPGPALHSDADFLQYARETGTSTQHRVGSCRMGSDALAVVDAQLRVQGLTGLRIADASVMPAVVSANTAGACLMIGERCADFVAQAHPDCVDAPRASAKA